MVLDRIIPDGTLSILKDLVETKAFYSTMVYPAVTSIIAGIMLYFLITRREFTQSRALRAITLLTKTREYLRSRRTEARVKTVYKSLGKKNALNTTALFELGSLVLGGVLIISILTKTLFLAMVTTQSMAPLIMPGDLVVAEAFTKNISVGDVIIFIPPEGEQMVIHRATSVSEGGIRTKGDNSFPDTWVLTKGNIIGKAISINQEPLVMRGLGYYFMPIDNPIRAQDPALKATRGYITTIQTYGPLISIIILLLIVLSMMRK